jgi:CYTH domain-containing protein
MNIVYVCARKSNRPKLQLRYSPLETEGKFLVANDEWKQSAIRGVSIRDGLIAVYKDRKVRVRISGYIATVAIKRPRIDIVRPEFEYEIPIAGAQRMLSTMCQDNNLELKQEGQELILRHWIGKEVTGDSSHKKINMRTRALNTHRQAATS